MQAYPHSMSSLSAMLASLLSCTLDAWTVFIKYTRVPTPPSASPSGAHESHPARVLGSGPLSPPLTPSHPSPAQPPPELLTGVEVVPGADDELRLHAAGNALHQTCRGDLR